ncbi:MAG TPA: AsmA-like C-terminal domain-containing protein [Candidatus Binataceae bacterium]|nr:AsmA-like C-terminal domain-containing protein [Candidatus Binataceae bacterium]
MKLLRAAVIALLSLAALLATAVAIALHNQARLISLVLEHIQERSGYQIVASDARLHFGTHLSVVLEHPSIQRGGLELIRSQRVRVLLSYHALIWNGGLPLRALVVVRPELRVPAGAGAPGLKMLPRPDSGAVRAVTQELREFSGLVERITIANARVSDATGQSLLEDFSLTAAPRRRHAKIWNIGFIAPRIHMAPTGLEVSGRMSIDTIPNTTDEIISNGELWFWNGRLDRDLGAGVTLNGLAHGDATFALHGNGEIGGRGNLAIDHFGAGGARLSQPIDLGNCSLKTIYAISTARIALADVEARVGTATVASGDLTVNDPFEADAALLAHLSAAQIDLAALKARLDTAHGLPGTLTWLAAALISGRATVEEAIYQGQLNSLGWNAAALASALRFSARLEAVSLKLPGAAALPALSRANAELSYAKGRVTLSQGSADLGRSSFQELSGDADFRSGHRQVRYQLRAAGTLDLDELYSAAKQLFPTLAAKAAGHIDRLSGGAKVRVTASGSFDIEAPAPPAKYLAKIETNGLRVTAKDLPQPIALMGGSVTLTPGNVALNRVMATVDKPEVPGAVTVNGNLAFDSSGLRLRQIAVELHQIGVQQWLPLLVDPQDIAARGPLGGTLTIMREPSRSQGLRANGRLTMGAGEIQLGFLRAPIVAQSATLSFDGRGLLLAIVGAKLQGAPLDFSLGVADLDKPVLKIVANAGRLNLEVMKFIRLPWAPSPPARFFPVPVVGHIEAYHATLERLAMSRVKCDFNREINGDWGVRNFTATMFDGHADMEFSGRGRDDWINVKGRVDGVQVGPLFSMADPAGQPPLSGRLKARGDLWANSNTDFFNTLAGTISIDVTDGVLHKFALLSRILGFVNLKTWLSAKVPDPRVNGVPFQTLTADLKGRDGDFYSDNLLLRGPVMNISALGHVRLGDGNVDMQVGMVPFKTVNWLVAKVPIIGSGLSSNHFVAAYFHVTGPLSNPHVVPQPITSVAYFLTNVLKLPLNILEGIGHDGGGGN